MTRRELREAALRVMFQLDLGRIPVEASLSNEIQEHGLSTAEEAFLRELVSGTAKHLEELDKIMAQYAQGWTVERMGTADRNVLRLAIHELLYMSSVPPRVSMNEAVELAKKYGDADSGRFVNGILASVARERLPQPLI